MPTTPTTFTELLKISWNLYTTRFRFILISGLLLIPMTILNLALLPDAAPFQTAVIDQITQGQGQTFMEHWMQDGYPLQDIIDLSTVPAWLALSGLSLIISTWGSLMIWLSVALGRHGVSISTQSGIRQATALLPRALGVVVLVSLFTWLGTLALVIPGIIISIGLTFAVPSLVTTQRGGLAALRDSWRTVRGSWWRVFWYTAATSLLVTFVLSALTYPLSSLLTVTTAAWQTDALFIVLDLLTTIGIGFVTVFIMVLFLELKEKKNETGEVA